jgi:UDP-N-acetyl-D-galactosamine dehydrogenase
LYKSSETVGSVLTEGDIVIYESTVYPGATEEECIPVLERFSGLKFNTDFFAGYSPERINPGDKLHTVDKILKVTSGSTKAVGEKVDALYKSIIVAGTYLAPSITKWNFLPFKPGLVGGHCIGVDPYYLAQKAQEVGYHPEIILAGRRVNDGMGSYIASQVVKLMIKRNIKVNHANILVLGFTFKENCPDIRNTKVIDVIKELKSYGTNVTIYDPWANTNTIKEIYSIEAENQLPEKKFDTILLAVGHKEFLNLKLENLLNPNGLIYDFKGISKSIKR